MRVHRQVLRILIISDVETDRIHIFKQLGSMNASLYVESAGTEPELTKKLESSWDLVIFKSHVQFMAPLAAMAQTKLKQPLLPFVFISHGIGDESVAELMKAGAEDIVSETRLHRLNEVVTTALTLVKAKERELLEGRSNGEAVAAREQMLAIVSHDIKNPLSAVQLEAQMLLRVADRHGKSLFAEEIKIQANRILKTTDRLKGLIVDLLDKNKTENNLSSLDKSTCDVARILQEVSDSNRPLMKEKGILLKTRPYVEILLEVDKNRLFQAMNNLLSNAIKFTPEGGMIEVNIEDHGAEYVFSVADTGPGLRPADLNRMFDKYWTAGVSGRSGTGLGLFICKTIIDAHGGHIGGENQLSGGARFWFTIPKPELVGSAFWNQDGKPKILVIDDDDDLREVISWALDQEGYAVHSYADPKEALESLKKGLHFPQMIVIDFQMEGMNGTEFLKLKRMIELPEVRNCPVVMISASPEDIDPDERQALVDRFIMKPLDLEALISNVKDLMIS